MSYTSKYTGEEIDNLLSQVESGGASPSIVVDSSLSLESENPVMNRVVTAELGKKAETDGVYSKMTVGRSVDLLGVEDVEEGSFVFRPTDGYGSIKDGVAAVKRVKGDSVVWNQLNTEDNAEGIIDNSNNSAYKYETLYNLPCYSSKIAGHIILAIATDKGSGVDRVYFTDNVQSNLLGGAIFTANTSANVGVVARVPANTIANYNISLVFTDLTKMYGAGNEPTTIDEYEARKPIVANEYAYNEGEVVNMKATGIKSVGFNAWDEEWELGAIDNNTGTITPSNSHIRSKNYIKVISGEAYHMLGKFVVIYYDENYNHVDWWSIGVSRELTIPNNVQYLKLYASGTTYNHDICINLVHSGYRNGEYEPYVEDVLDLPTLDLFPNGMNKISKVYDEYDEEKSVQRIDSVDLWTLGWYYTADFGGYYSDMLYTAPTDFLGICSVYPFVGKYINVNDKEMGVILGQSILIKDSAYTDVESFKAMLQEKQVKLYYELSEPIVTPHKQRLVYKAWDFGTEQIIAEGNTTAITAGITYEFNARDTIRGNKAKNEEQDERMRILEGEVVRKGDYSPENKVGLADDLAGRGESAPAEFGFRASGGKSIKDGRAYIKRIKGNSVVWNQWAKSFEEAYEKPYDNKGITYNGNKVTIDNWRSYQPFRFDIKCSTAKDHLYLVLLNYANTNPDQQIYIEFGGENSFPKKIGNIECFHRNIIYNNDYKDAFTLYLAETLEGTITLSDLQVIDLTKMFGAGNEPTTIEKFNAMVATLGIDMYAYNEGEVIHCNTESIKSVGDNALNVDRSLVFDFVGSYGDYDFINTEDAFVGISADGYINGRSIDYAEKIEGGFKLRSNAGGYGIGLFVKALPNEEYSVSYTSDNGRIALGFYDKDKNFISYESWENHFTTPSNCEYIMLCLRDNEVVNIDISFTDIMLTLVHSGWKQDTDAGYQPYWADTLPLPIISKYFPDGMKLAGTAHDEIRFNKAIGKWEYSKGRIKAVDMGTLSWGMAFAEQGYNVFLTDAFIAKYDNEGLNIINKKYIPAIVCMDSIKDKQCRLFASGEGVMLYVRDTDYTDVESFKASLQGVMLYYESKDWEWVELDAEDQNFRDYYNVADFGTEQSKSLAPSAAFSADIIYQFNAVDMIREHELEITELQNIIATMQAQLASLTSNNA